jgi:hypothetical protein
VSEPYRLIGKVDVFLIRLCVCRLAGELICRKYGRDSSKYWKVVSLKYTEDEDEYLITIRSVDDPTETEKIDGEELCSEWLTLPPAHVLNRWDRYQSKRIAEGVWMATADPALQMNVNRCVDAFAAAETPDYHPGTNGIVRDLVHPSLYPLIQDPATIDTKKRNRWYRPYERSRFQWLPTEVTIATNGSATFTSEINNLDAVKYPELKETLEQIFAALVPGFEKVSKFSVQ